MNIAYRIPRRTTTDEFLAMPPHRRGLKQELVDGEVITVSPASVVHGQIQANIAFLLRAHIVRNAVQAKVITEATVVPNISAKSNARVPDLAVSRGTLVPNQKILNEPLVLIEVLSLHNERDTRGSIIAYSTIPTVREIVAFSSTRIEAELLLRAPDGTWPKSATLIKAPEKLSIPSIGFECLIDEFYNDTPITL